ncbi:hypothetical protein EDD11_009774 [Mortierella claussenii]|nr:hypothetical protein EDD11_009774 [Mortierella claussenii]
MTTTNVTGIIAPAIGNPTRCWATVRQRENPCTSDFAINSVKRPQIILIVLIVSDTSEKPTPPGEFPESNYTSSFSQVIDPDIYTKLMLRLNQGILGNIVVSQSQDWLEDNIIIHGTIQSSTVTMLKLTTPVLAFKPNSSRAISIVSLNMSESDRKEAFDQQNWTRVDVQIMFPRHFEDFDALTIEHLHRGSIRIQDTAVQDTMMLLATDGNVVLQEIEVNRQLMVDARNGQVKGKSISAPRLVKVNAAQDVELELVSYSSRLDVRVVSKSYAEVVMTRPFYGHFLVETTYWLSYPKLDLTPYYVLRKNDSGIREGYTTWDGYEPALLPRIDIKGRTAKLKA